MRKARCPRQKTCLWCRWRVALGQQGRASCLERALWAPTEAFDWNLYSLTEGYPMEAPHPQPPTLTHHHHHHHHQQQQQHSTWSGDQGHQADECSPSAGTSLIVAEMLEASGVGGAQQIRDLIEDIIHFRMIPTEWQKRIIIYLDKGKGVTLEQGNYRGLKLLGQLMKVLECCLSHLLFILSL